MSDDRRDDALHVEWVDEPANAPDAAESARSASRQRAQRRRQAGGVAVVAALALVGAGMWHITHRPPPAPLVVTVGGRVVDDAAVALTRAEAVLSTYARAHHGVTSARTRCYFDRAAGRVKTDVGAHVFCGPVLFHGGSVTKPYLSYRLAMGPITSDGHVTMVAASSPDAATPNALPTGAHLERPDRRTPPKGADGLLAPPPAPVRLNYLTLVSTSAVPKLPAVPATSAMGARDAEVHLEASGRISALGSGMSAVGPAPGQALWAFKLVAYGTQSPFASTPTFASFGVSIDGSTPRPIPLNPYPSDGSNEQTAVVIASVPRTARKVDLVMADAGVSQSLSLLTGKPADDDIVLYQRPFGSRVANQSPSITVPATISDGARTLTTHVTVDLDSGSLDYFVPFGPGHASAANRVLLSIEVCLRSPDVIGQDNGYGNCHPYDSSDFTVTPTGGAPIHPRDYGGGFVAVDVSAHFTTGVVTLVGSENLGNQGILRFDKQVVLKIGFPR